MVTLRQRLTAIVPGWAKLPVRFLREEVRRWRYRGENRFCPVCETPSRKFEAFGLVPREDARCVHCGALERHRLVWLFLWRKTDLFDGRPKRMLHVAAEPFFASRLRAWLGPGYVTADLNDPRAMVRLDVTEMPFADDTFDVVYCSHVLEHVPDDRRAMREFHRVLRKDGWAVIQVPLTADRTFEDPAVQDPDERRRLFGQEDHVRRYGPDFVERLQEAGFAVEVFQVADLAPPGAAERLGLTAASGQVFYCTKK